MDVKHHWKKLENVCIVYGIIYREKGGGGGERESGIERERERERERAGGGGGGERERESDRQTDRLSKILTCTVS